MEKKPKMPVAGWVALGICLVAALFLLRLVVTGRSLGPDPLMGS